MRGTSASFCSFSVSFFARSLTSFSSVATWVQLRECQHVIGHHAKEAIRRTFSTSDRVRWILYGM